MNRIPDDSEDPSAETYGICVDGSAAIKLLQAAVQEVPAKYLIQYFSNTRTVVVNSSGPEQYGENFYETTTDMLKALGTFSEEEGKRYTATIMDTSICVSSWGIGLLGSSDEEWQNNPQKCMANAATCLSEEVLPPTFALLNHWGIQIGIKSLAVRLVGVINQLFDDRAALDRATLTGPYPPVTNKEWLKLLGDRAPYMPALLDGFRFGMVFRQILLKKMLKMAGAPIPPTHSKN